MAQTISMSSGRIAIRHDIRDIFTPNIDKSLTERNMILRDELKDFDYDLEKYTDAYFQPYLDEYNAKQKRDDRKKLMPYTHYVKQENLKREAKNLENMALGFDKKKVYGTQLGYEFVLQHGNHETNPTLHCVPQKETEYFEKAIKGIEKKYPHMKILLATVHLDEPNGTPHCHILVQFVGERYKQGISHQLSVSKALELDGLERADTRSDGYQMERMTKDIKDNVMTPLLKEIYQEERDIIGEERGNMPLSLFRKKTREEYEVLQAKEKAVDKHAEDLQCQINNLKSDLRDLEIDMSILTANIDQKRAENKTVEENLAEKEESLRKANNNLEQVRELINSSLESMDKADVDLVEVQNIQNQAQQLFQEIKIFEKVFQESMEKAYGDVFDEHEMMRARTRYNDQIEPRRTSLEEKIRRADESLRKANKGHHQTKEIIQNNKKALKHKYEPEH